MPDNDDAARLQRIVGDHADGRLPCHDARAAVAEVVLDRVDADRVSFWRFVHPEVRGDRSLELHCFAARWRGKPLDACDDRLVLDEYRAYWNAVIVRGTLASADALHDPVLAPMRPGYLEKHDIRSLLDAAFSLNGRAYGMICCETMGRRVAWRTTDVQALRAIATRLAVLLASSDGVAELWNNPSLPLAQIEPTPLSPSPRS